MDTDLPTSLVFLDTSIYISSNYGFTSQLFSALKARIDNKQATLGITKITIAEVESNIRQGVIEAEQSIEKTRKQARILRNATTGTISSLFNAWDKDNVIEELIDRFHVFLKEFDVVVLGYEEIDVESVFGLYFNKKPPFGDGKKKDEFPDAFVMGILENWGDSETQSVYLVSADNDFVSNDGDFPHLERIKSLADLLSLLSFKYEELAPLCAKAYENVREAVNIQITSKFAETGFYIDDQQGDVNEVSDVEMNDYDPRLLWVDYDGAIGFVHCEFEVIAKINFIAHLSYDDLATAAYDSEDKVLIPWNTIDEEVNSSEIIMTTVVFSFNKENINECNLEDVDVSLSDSIGVTSGEGSEWPYK